MDLGPLGWDGFFGQAFEPYEADGLLPARVCAEHRGAWRVLAARGELPAALGGRLRHASTRRADLPVVGDWVAVRTGDDGAAAIDAVLPRRSAFVRKVAGAVTDAQVVAANIDVVFLVTGLDGDYNLRRVERAVTLAWESGAQPVVVLNKADLCDDAEARVAEVTAAAPGVPVHATSTVREGGVDVFAGYLAPGRTAALLGSSGVGKSTIINRLVGREVLRTAAVRDDDDRGRHTTTHRQLLVLPGGGMIIDTPGMRELQLWGDGDGVGQVFADIEALAPSCRYRDCAHEAEPGCAVRAAVDAGALAPGRLASFHKLQRELRHLEFRVDGRAALEEKRRWKSIHKLAKQFKPRQ